MRGSIPVSGVGDTNMTKRGMNRRSNSALVLKVIQELVGPDDCVTRSLVVDTLKQLGYDRTEQQFSSGVDYLVKTGRLELTDGCLAITRDGEQALDYITDGDWDKQATDLWPPGGEEKVKYMEDTKGKVGNNSIKTGKDLNNDVPDEDLDTLQELIGDSPGILKSSLKSDTGWDTEHLNKVLSVLYKRNRIDSKRREKDGRERTYFLKGPHGFNAYNRIKARKPGAVNEAIEDALEHQKKKSEERKSIFDQAKAIHDDNREKFKDVAHRLFLKRKNLREAVDRDTVELLIRLDHLSYEIACIKEDVKRVLHHDVLLEEANEVLDLIREAERSMEGGGAE